MPVASRRSNLPKTRSEARKRVREVREVPIGSTATKVISGKVNEEILFDLFGIKGIDKYTEMPRVDAMIRACWLTTILPLVEAEPSVILGGVDESSSDTEKRNAEEVLEFCVHLLFRNAERSFVEMLRDWLRFLQYGYYVGEKVFYLGEGDYAWLRDIYNRHPRSIASATKSWEFNQSGDKLVAVWQRDIYRSLEERRGNGDHEVRIPRENLLIITNEQEGNNYEGMSNLRPCWRPYYAKKALIQILLIGLERQALGMPVAHMSETFSTRRENQLISLVTNWRGGEDSGAVLSAGEALEILEGKIQADKLMTAIEYMDREMANAWTTGFLMFGQQAAGGYALSADRTDLFMVSENALGNFVNGNVRRDVLQPAVELNFGTDWAKYTPYIVTSVARENKAQIADMWYKLASGDNPLLTVSEDDEDYLRRELKLPKRTDPRRPFVVASAKDGGTQKPQPGTKDSGSKPEKAPTQNGG